MDKYTIIFPKQATLAYIDSFLKSVRKVLNSSRSRIILDFSKTTEMSSLAICFLCGLLDLSVSKKNRVSIVLPRNKRAAEVLRSLKELTQTNQEPKIRIAKRMCQARKITGNNNAYLREILDLLYENLKTSVPSTKDSLLIVLTELLTNAIDHSGEKSCYVAAGAWGRSHFLHVTLLDFGMGIPQKLRTRYPQYEDDREALRILLEKGLTTRVGLEGGRGYQYIQKILQKNQGRLHIFSGKTKIIFKYDKGEYHYKRARIGFTGTCVDIQFNLKGEGLYSLMKDDPSEDIFL